MITKAYMSSLQSKLLNVVNAGNLAQPGQDVGADRVAARDVKFDLLSVLDPANQLDPARAAWIAGKAVLYQRQRLRRADRDDEVRSGAGGVSKIRDPKLSINFSASSFSCKKTNPGLVQNWPTPPVTAA